MATIWTHGRWIAKPGREEDLVAALRSLAREAAEAVAAPTPTLLRDRTRPNVFLTFAPWESMEAIDRFRAFVLPRVEEMTELLESFEPFTLDEVPFDD